MCLAREISTYRRSFWLVLTGHGGGLAERIALYPLIIWLVVFGVSCVSSRGTPQAWPSAANGGACRNLGRDDLPGQRGGHVVIAHERPLERARAVGHRTQIDGVPGQLMCRHLCVNNRVTR